MKKIIFILALFALFLASNSFAISQRVINEGIKMCQSDKEMLRISGLSRSKYNSFCVCYINGIIGDGDKRKEYKTVRDNCL
jgi:hypothetical protein|tara:strand:- start:602 stop:844 length:243 start_codon:yes stop_codon:yes gene_type:complete